MQRMPEHVREEDLEQYCLGTLAEEGYSRLEEHLLICESCRERLTETETYVAAMQQASLRFEGDGAKHMTAGGGRGTSWSGTVVPVIAGVVVVCGAVWFGHHSSAPPPAPFAVELAAVRGSAAGQAPAGRPLLLKLDLTGLSDGQPFLGEVVDAAGGRIAQFSVTPSPQLKALAPGSYFVRINRTTGELLREYSLTVKP